jgi:F-type H+-transporting ATPase subunit b
MTGAAVFLLLLLALPEPALAASESGGESSWGPTIAKAANFAMLVGLLVYFLRGTVTAYLAARRDTIRKDLAQARELKAEAERQLTSVRSQLAALPAEIEALERQGQQDLHDERIRMKEATERLREQMVDRTRREIDRRLRLARRSLTEHTADLAVRLARERIQGSMTADDQTRLIDRYAREVRP